MSCDKRSDQRGHRSLIANFCQNRSCSANQNVIATAKFADHKLSCLVVVSLADLRQCQLAELSHIFANGQRRQRNNWTRAFDLASNLDEQSPYIGPLAFAKKLNQC